MRTWGTWREWRNDIVAGSLMVPIGILVILAVYGFGVAVDTIFGEFAKAIVERGTQ